MGAWGDRETVGFGKVYHPSGVPLMSHCSPPPGLFGGQGPLPPHHAEKYMIPWINICLGQLGVPTCLWDTVDLFHHAAVLWCRVWDHLGRALMGHDIPSVVKLFTGWRDSQLGCSAQWRMGVYCLWSEALSSHIPQISVPTPPFGVRVCLSLSADSPGLWPPPRRY